MGFYLLPIVAGTGVDSVSPKYLRAFGVGYMMVDFGQSAICFAPLTGPQETTLAGNADAVIIPPLDNTIGAGALATVQNSIEALDMPAGWVTVGMTYRTVLRVLIGMAQLVQRVTGILGFKPVIAGNLNKTISQLPANVQTGLTNAVDSLGLSRTGITGATTLRAALLDIGQQFVSGRGIVFGTL